MKLLQCFILFLILIMAGCTRDEFQNPSENQPIVESGQPDLNIDTRMASISEIPKLNDRLTKIFDLATSNRITNSGGLPFTEEDLDLENIIVVTDNDLNFTNYTITVNDLPDENLFYNIIATEDDLGNLGSPVLYEFEMEPEFADQYANGEVELSEFEGTISRYNLLAFFDSNPFDGVVRSEPDPCDETPVGSNGGSTGGSGNTGGSGSSSGSTPTPSGGGQSPCHFETFTVPCCACPGGCSNLITITVIMCDESQASLPSSDDCPGQSGSAGVNYPEDSDPSAPYSNIDEGMYYMLLNQGYTPDEISRINDAFGDLSVVSSSEVNNAFSLLTSRTDLLIEARLEAVEIYSHLLKNDSDFRTYALYEHAALPSWTWPFIKDIGIEIAKELATRYGPAGVVNDVVQAVGNLGQGDILGFLGEVVDIVRRKVPALAAVSLTLDGIELGGKAAKVWKAIAKMEKIGGEAIEKLLSTISSKAGGLLGKFEWRNQNYGADLIDVGDPLVFWEDLIALFPNKIEVLNPPLNEIVYKIPPTNWELKFYVDANTQGKTTIQFKSPQGYKFKVRF